MRLIDIHPAYLNPSELALIWLAKVSWWLTLTMRGRIYNRYDPRNYIRIKFVPDTYDDEEEPDMVV